MLILLPLLKLSRLETYLYRDQSLLVHQPRLDLYTRAILLLYREVHCKERELICCLALYLDARLH